MFTVIILCKRLFLKLKILTYLRYISLKILGVIKYFKEILIIGYIYINYY